MCVHIWIHIYKRTHSSKKTHHLCIIYIYIYDVTKRKHQKIDYIYVYIYTFLQNKTVVPTLQSCNQNICIYRYISANTYVYIGTYRQNW